MLHAKAIFAVFVSIISARSRIEACWVPCTPPPQFPLCHDCTREDLKTAIKPCYPLLFSKPVRHDDTPVIMYTMPTDNRFGVGNYLGQYFHVRGIAKLAKTVFLTNRRFNVSGITLPSSFEGEWGNYTQVPLLEHGCATCPPSRVRQFPHTCAGPWLYSDAVDLLRAAVSKIHIQTDYHPIIIQFRCSDTYYRYKYGMPEWDFYYQVLATPII